MVVSHNYVVCSFSGLCMQNSFVKSNVCTFSKFPLVTSTKKLHKPDKFACLQIV